MENPDKEIELLQSARPEESMEMNTGVSLDAEQEQQDDSEPDTQPEPNQETPEPTNSLPLQAPIEFRMQQLRNRRFLLLKTQHLRKKAEDNSDGTTKEILGLHRERPPSPVTSEDSDELCELEAIQKELEELLVKKEELEKQKNSSHLGQQDTYPTFYKPETPCGGIYMLPPPQLPKEEKVKTMPAAERPEGPVVAVDSLGQAPAVTQCPSCQEVIITETCSKVGDAAWMLCCLCSITGCCAGCCLIPFCMDHLKDVHHQCPHCQTRIHTHQPF